MFYELFRRVQSIFQYFMRRDLYSRGSKRLSSSNYTGDIITTIKDFIFFYFSLLKKHFTSIAQCKLFVYTHSFIIDTFCLKINFFYAIRTTIKIIF